MTQIFSSKRKRLAKKVYNYLAKFNARISIRKTSGRYYVIYEGIGG